MIGSQKAASQQALFGAYEEPIREAIARAAADRIVERIWERDASLWKSDAPAQNEIRERLGWLDAPF